MFSVSLRESPALYITQKLIDNGLDILAVEPNIEALIGVDVVSLESALKQSDIVTFLVGHKQFKNLNLKSKLDFCGVLK